MFSKLIVFLIFNLLAPVKFSAMSEADQTQTVMVGCPVALLCELSDPNGQVHWYKDGAKLIPPPGVDIQSDGNIRRLTIQSAQSSHSGVYQCETKDDAIQFSVDVKGDKRTEVLTISNPFGIEPLTG